MPRQKFLIIHGHFYQPPRENPWLGVIERQESASPYPNWNERITAECYKANTLSRTLDPRGRILDIVNNFKYLSFNVGPTLLNWLQENHPATYEAIIAADHESRSMNSGHGNAIAQVSNHVIMPLATRKEQVLQIVWGIKDFKRHFGREPESIWLAETAINHETVQLLIEHGIRFVILSPYQANRVKEMESTEWKNVSKGTIDTTRPYRIFGSGGHLDVFFYNKTLSQAVAFEHLLRDAHKFGEKLSPDSGKGDGPSLTNICTDGESYGHHEAFGDMCLAAFFTDIAVQKGFTVTNYGNYLEKFPPAMEVELKSGKNGEGTSWSCCHGVGRWYEDCGCSTGGHEKWNQKWREPLRKGLRKLKENLDEDYEKKTRPYFHDPAAPLFDYIDLKAPVVQPDFDSFFSRHTNRTLTEEEKGFLLRLLESQWNSHLMFTSCAWFFDDISGIEPMQNLKYAARAIELSDHPELEGPFLEELEKAKSNLKGQAGRDLYLKKIAPLAKTYELIANQALMESILLEKHSGRYYFYDASVNEYEQLGGDGLTLGEVLLADSFLRSSKKYFFICFRNEQSFLQTWLGKDTPDEIKERIVGRLREWERNPSEYGPASIAEEFGLARYGLSDLLECDREEILQKAMARGFEPLKKTALHFFHEKKDLIRQMVRFDFDLPAEIRLIVRYAVHHQLKEQITLLRDSKDLKRIENVREWINFANLIKIPLKMDFEKKVLVGMLLEKLKALFTVQDVKSLEEATEVINLIREIRFEVDIASAQNCFFEYLKGPFKDLVEELKRPERDGVRHEFANKILELADTGFGINVDRFRGQLPP